MSRQLQIGKLTEGPDRCTLLLTGTIDLTTYDTLDRAFADALTEGQIHLNVDLAKVDYIASAGFGIFIEALATVRERGGSLKFVNPSPKARDLFRLLGILADSCQF